MPKLSSAAWIAHDIGLAAAIGGTTFGRVALQPALRTIGSPLDADRASDIAWRRFSWINLAAHGAFAATWLIGRTMLNGREVSARARTLTSIKDALVGASLVTGVASILLGRKLGRRGRQGLGPAQLRATEPNGHSEQDVRRTLRINRAVGALGIANLIATTAIAAVTTVLAMEASTSRCFGPRSRRLP